MLETGIIEASESSYRSNIFLVPKPPDKEGNKKVKTSEPAAAALESEPTHQLEDAIGPSAAEEELERRPPTPQAQRRNRLERDRRGNWSHDECLGIHHTTAFSGYNTIVRDIPRNGTKSIPMTFAGTLDSTGACTNADPLKKSKSSEIPTRYLTLTIVKQILYIRIHVCKTIDTGHSSTPTRSASHHSCLIGSSSSRRTHQVKNLFRLLEKTNNASFRPCRIFLLIGAIQASIGACKAWSHCEDE
ncbi:unnamed protein product [Trichogramma brassicae]|uniref:Uncharacterized protein n=1 Tax=Trichogramma brassicae TaxID=86971 RepID=A0A6H5J2L1_9HYME|nr:unnamed protein product [Trichogramma brassicae]